MTGLLRFCAANCARAAPQGDALNVLVFFVVVASLFPLGRRARAEPAARDGGGVAWIAAPARRAAVAAAPVRQRTMPTERSEQMLVSPQPLVLVVLAKIAAHWLCTGLPLALAGAAHRPAIQTFRQTRSAVCLHRC
jgi:heme exporter protein CcmB